LRFPGVGVIFGMAVMARRTDRRDRGVRGIPGMVADRGAWVARVGAGLNAGGAGGIRGMRAEGERGVTATRVFKGANELSWTVFENTRDLLGDLLGAKNAGVTNLTHLK
jgi:hypothetical protein